MRKLFSDDFDERTLGEELLDFYRRAPALTVPHREPFRITTELQQLGGINRPDVEEPRRPTHPPKKPLLGIEPLPPPVIYNPEHGVDNVRIHWDAVIDPATNSTAGVTYHVFRSIGGSGYVQTGTNITGGTGPTRSLHDFGLPADTNIYYVMRSATADRESENSLEIIVHTDPVTTPPPVTRIDLTKYGVHWIGFQNTIRNGEGFIARFNVRRILTADPVYVGPIFVGDITPNSIQLFNGASSGYLAINSFIVASSGGFAGMVRVDVSNEADYGVNVSAAFSSGFLNGYMNCNPKLEPGNPTADHWAHDFTLAVNPR